MFLLAFAPEIITGLVEGFATSQTMTRSIQATRIALNAIRAIKDDDRNDGQTNDPARMLGAFALGNLLLTKCLPGQGLHTEGAINKANLIAQALGDAAKHPLRDDASFIAEFAVALGHRTAHQLLSDGHNTTGTSEAWLTLKDRGLVDPVHLMFSAGNRWDAKTIAMFKQLGITSNEINRLTDAFATTEVRQWVDQTLTATHYKSDVISTMHVITDSPVTLFFSTLQQAIRSAQATQGFEMNGITIPPPVITARNRHRQSYPRVVMPLIIVPKASSRFIEEDRLDRAGYAQIGDRKDEIEEVDDPLTDPAPIESTSTMQERQDALSAIRKKMMVTVTKQASKAAKTIFDKIGSKYGKALKTVEGLEQLTEKYSK